jgi:hypothetical protein
MTDKTLIQEFYYKNLQSVTGSPIPYALRGAKCDVFVKNVVAVFSCSLECTVPVAALGVQVKSRVEVDAGQLHQEKPNNLLSFLLLTFKFTQKNFTIN